MKYDLEQNLGCLFSCITSVFQEIAELLKESSSACSQDSKCGLHNSLFKKRKKKKLHEVATMNVEDAVQCQWESLIFLL